MQSKPSLFELLFNIFYLITILSLSVNLLTKNGFGNESSRIYHLAGFMSLILVLGDSFKLIPRITAHFSKKTKNLDSVLSKGSLISSITSTFFFILLWNLGIIIFSAQISAIYTILVYILAFIRILLCLISQKYSENYVWDIYRNLPFAFLVFVVGFLYFYYRYKIYSLVYAWVAIFFSLLFSLIIIFLSSKSQKISFWIILRNLSLIWLVSMFLEL